MTAMELILIALNGLILPITSFVLYSVMSMQKSMAVTVAGAKNQDREIVELRARVTACEAHLVDLRIQMSQRETEK